MSDDLSDSPMVQALRGQLQALRAENAELREGIAWRDNWIRELRDAVAVLTKAVDEPEALRLKNEA